MAATLSDIGSYFVNLFMLLTISVYIMFLLTLFKNRRDEILGQPFFKLMFSVCVAAVFQIATIFFTVLFTQAEFFPQVAIRMGGLASRVSSIGFFGFGSAQHFGVLLLAINRFTAYLYPTKQSKLWSNNTIRNAIIIQWTIAIVNVSPLFHSYFEFTVEIQNGTAMLEWKIAEQFAFYNLVVSGLYGGTIAITVFFLYIIIFSAAIVKRCSANQPMTNLEKTVLKMTATGFLSSIGLFVLLINIAVYELAWYIYHINFPSVATFSWINNFGIYFYSAVKPFAMFLFSSIVRKRFRQLFCCCLLTDSTVIPITSVHKAKSLNRSQVDRKL